MTTRTTTLRVDGMSCTACVAHVREALAFEGIARVDVRLDAGTVTVAHDERVGVERLIAELYDAGYEARDAAGNV